MKDQEKTRLLVTMTEDMKRDMKEVSQSLSRDMITKVSLAQLARMGIREVIQKHKRGE